MRFAENLTNAEIADRIERLRGNNNLKAIQERKLLLVEQNYKKENPPIKQKRTKYPCSACSAPLNSTRCYKCSKIIQWRNSPTKSRDYGELSKPLKEKP